MSDLVRLCAWCHRQCVIDPVDGRERWVNIDPRSRAVITAQGHVTHGVCPACKDDVLEDRLEFLAVLRGYLERVLAAVPQPVAPTDHEREAIRTWLHGTTRGGQ